MRMLPSGLSEVIEDDEYLARFLTSASQFNAVMVKPSAFLPNPRDSETSVFRHRGEPRDELWKIGRDYAVGDRTLHGAAIFQARNVRDALLEVVASEPPPKHASIVRWPWFEDDPEMHKAHQKERAALIARYAELVRA